MQNGDRRVRVGVEGAEGVGERGRGGPVDGVAALRAIRSTEVTGPARVTRTASLTVRRPYGAAHERAQRAHDLVRLGGRRDPKATAGPTSASPQPPTSAAAVSPTSCGGQLPGGDPVAQPLADHRRVARAVGQALGINARIDRLGDQRPGEPRVASARRANVASTVCSHSPVAGAGRIPRRRPHRPLLARADRAEHLDEQLLLGGEVAIQGAGGHACALGDRDHRGGAVAALLHQLLGGGQQTLAGAGARSRSRAGEWRTARRGSSPPL